MEKQLLTLTPTRFLCPICGEWHEWKHSHHLGYYDSTYPAEFTNSSLYPRECASDQYTIFVKGEYLHYTTGRLCGHASLNLNGKIRIESIIEHTDQPIVTFDVPFTAKNAVGRYENNCRTCSFQNKCNLIKLSENGDSIYMKIPLGFEFEKSEYMRFAKVGKMAQKERELLERETAVKDREQSVHARETAVKGREQSVQARETAVKGKEKTLQARESALSSKEQAYEQQQQRAEELARGQEIKEETTMANNNIFNMNLEFGPNKDENIASTLMGVAVKNGDSWRIYDKKKKEITDVGDMQLGNLPIFILPTIKLTEGDLIKDGGEYYFVNKVEAGSTQTLCAKTGEMKTVIPIKNLMGFSCYSKVIAFSDSVNMGGDFDIEKLAIMSAMSGQSGEDGGQMNQLLPLMLFKDKLGGDDDMMKMMIMSSMMTPQAEGNDQNAGMNQMLPFMLMKDKDGGDDDMMKMMIMSSMMGGNMAGNNNPVMNYLMLDMFMGKKKDEKAQQPTQTSPETIAE